MSGISLYQIESALEQLAEERERAEAESDSQALEAIDKALEEYLTREPQKVASYVGYIRSVEARALACKAEKERYAELQRRAEASVERMKANVLATMQRFEIKAMVDTRTGQGFRRQGNGGYEPLDIPEWPKDGSGKFAPMPDGYRVASVPTKTFTVPDLDTLRTMFKHGGEVPGARLLPRGEHIRVI